MSFKESIKFVIVGVLATILSLIGFEYMLKVNGAYAATLVRWSILIPVLYIGYSRFVLIDTLITNKKIHGSLKAEFIMIYQVALAVGASFLIKLICEPIITNFLIKKWGMSNAYISPILADFLYGPIVNYYILHKFNLYNKNQSKEKEVSALLSNPSASLSTSLVNTIMINIVSKLADIFKFWKYPRLTDGCFENMTILDKLYWIYKAQRPILYPQKNSGVDKYFINNGKVKLTLPSDFEVIESIDFSAVGDLMQNDLLNNSSDSLYKNIGDLIFDSDISFGNLESPLTSQEKQEFIFSNSEAPPTYISQEQFDVLKGFKDKKYTVMSTACNHSYDYGFEGVTTTIERLKDENIISIGTNLIKDNVQKATIINSGNIKVGFVGFTFGLNGKKVPKEKEYCINTTNLNEKHKDIDLSLIISQIEDCKKNECDLTVLSLHWGLEYELYPTKRQLEIAHLLVEKGADLIISHHPHVVQPVEYYKTKRDPNRIAVICYSLGNLVNPFSDVQLSISLLLRLSFVKGLIGNELKTYIGSCDITPVFQEVDFIEGKEQISLKKLSEVDKLSENTWVNDICNILGDKICNNRDSNIFSKNLL